MACGILAKELIIVAALLDKGQRITTHSVRDHVLHSRLGVKSEPLLTNMSVRTGLGHGQSRLCCCLPSSGQCTLMVLNSFILERMMTQST